MQPPLMPYQRNQSANPRTMDKLEQHYKQEEYSSYLEHKNQQNLYYRIAQMESAKHNYMKNMEKEEKLKQNQRYRQYWKAEEERFRDLQRRRKEQVDNVRKVNSSLIHNLEQQAKNRDNTPIVANDYGVMQSQIFLQQKRQKEKLFKMSQQLERIKQEQQKNNKKMDMEMEQYKLKQREQQQYKRLAELRRIRDKHQQNMQAYSSLDEKMRQKQADESKVDQYFVRKGAEEHYARFQNQINEHQMKVKRDKQEHIRSLSNQLNQDTYRQQSQRRSLLQNQRNSIEARNRYFSQMDKINKMRKLQENKRVLETLKNQVKPRRLAPEPEVPENVGLGSPVNIGKVMGDDRKRQLDWIERSLLRQMFH